MNHVYEPVVLQYASLQPGAQLDAELERAFGADGLGLLVISDVPVEFAQLREAGLKQARRFATLPDEVLTACIDEPSSYCFGWSHGKERFGGRFDLAKGSYYFNPAVDRPAVSSHEVLANPALYRPNVWPSADAAPGFEPAVKALASFLLGVASRLAVVLDSYVAAHVGQTAQAKPLTTLLAESQCHKARLLHYFPTDGQLKEEDDLCGWHIDNSLITALCPAMYVDDTTGAYVKCPDEKSGLWIRPRGSKAAVRVTIPPNCVAFQTGEALELLSEGRLCATPHCVRGGSPGVSRETMAVFLQPDVDEVVDLKTGETFGAFAKRVFARHFDAPPV